MNFALWGHAPTTTPAGGSNSTYQPTVPRSGRPAPPPPGEPVVALRPHAGPAPDLPLPDRMPEVGLDPHVYARDARLAKERNDHAAHESAKVGMYLTLAAEPSLRWKDRLRYFRHALDRHCEPPPFATERQWLFYKDLAHLVREHCGRTALKLCSRWDDDLAARLAAGEPREQLADEAGVYFAKFLPDSVCPDWFLEQDWRDMEIMRDQWV